jgi:energy-converting hydrogenase A subunit F
MIIQRISRYISNFENLMPLFAAACAVLAAIAILSLPFVYAEDQLYPKHIDRGSPLDPYDRGGPPFTQADIKVQYPENSPTAGYVTAYLTPFSWALANTTLHTGTTIVGHPGGILDEILYNTRGLDTVVETTILFIAFAIASYIFRKGSQ